MDFDAWVEAAPAAIKNDAIWRVQAFRIGAFLSQCAADDAKLLKQKKEFNENISQLVRAAGSIAANVAEGYSRRSRPERLRYYEYALGSANESKAWYLSLRAALGDEITDCRFSLLARVSQLLLVMIRNERIGLEGRTSRRIPGSGA
jgi:four helix bundle protein